MRKFDTKVQHLKYKVLREVARHEWAGDLAESVPDIPKAIVPGKKPTMRCCVYKERAILSERIKAAMGGDRNNPNVIEVIDIACDECPVGGYEVTNACRGCLAHRCEDVCRRGAITFDQEHVAHIDKDKCVECGACAKVCPYTAIVSRKRPCQNACKIKAISMNADKAALGADMVAQAESKELAEKGFLTSSCCPAFVTYIRKTFPKLADNISHNLSPMAMISRYIKETTPGAKIVFIGPCTAKKMEIQQDSVREWVDVALTFEELQALFDSRDLDITTMEEDVLDNASYFGRIFARCGGLSDAVAEGLKEQGIDFDLKGCSCDGIEACRMALLKASRNVLDANFIEGMACIGGCIGGAGCLTHGEKNRAEVDKYGHEAHEKTIADAVSVLK